MGGAVRGVFRLQHSRILAHYGLSFLPPTKARVKAGGAELLGKTPLDLRRFAGMDARRVVPALEVKYDAGARAALARMGMRGGPDVWSVRLPQVQQALAQHSVRLCADTAATTNLSINRAIAQLKEDLSAGLLSEANTARALSQSVSDIFHAAERYRVDRIALTESSMAVHDGEILAGAASGVVSGYEPLLSPDACEICVMMAAAFPRVVLSEALAGLGKYSGPAAGDARSLPPYHANCMCSMTEVLEAVGG